MTNSNRSKIARKSRHTCAHVLSVSVNLPAYMYMYICIYEYCICIYVCVYRSMYGYINICRSVVCLLVNLFYLALCCAVCRLFLFLVCLYRSGLKPVIQRSVALCLRVHLSVYLSIISLRLLFDFLSIY